MKTKNELNQIRGKLLIQNVTMPMIAEKFECSRQFVHQVISGEHKSEKADEIRDFVEAIVKMETHN